MKLLVLASEFDTLRPVAGSAEVLGLDYRPQHGCALSDAITLGSDAREPGVEWETPLLIVYTSGTTGRPKGAVLTQQALLSNAVMSQHMHDMTAADHVLTVLPFFHVGGLNIQTTPALQLGATVTIHPRFTPKPRCTASPPTALPSPCWCPPPSRRCWIIRCGHKPTCRACARSAPAPPSCHSRWWRR